MRYHDGTLRWSLSISLVLLLGFGASANAQTGQIYGEITGKVVDGQGGVLPGVTVTLTAGHAHGGEGHGDERTRALPLSVSALRNLLDQVRASGLSHVRAAGTDRRRQNHGDAGRRAGGGVGRGDRHGDRRIAGCRRHEYEDGLPSRVRAAGGHADDPEPVWRGVAAARRRDGPSGHRRIELVSTAQRHRSRADAPTKSRWAARAPKASRRTAPTTTPTST